MALPLLFALFTTHLICDYLLQPSWILTGKGDFRSPGGNAHAGLHGLCTAVLLVGFGMAYWLWLGIIDAVVHYMIDRWKVRLGRRAKLTPNLPQLWWAFGLDQYAHVLTYLAIVWLVGRLDRKCRDPLPATRRGTSAGGWKIVGRRATSQDPGARDRLGVCRARPRLTRA